MVAARGVDRYHFDPYSQALSKIERGFEQDLADVRSMMQSGLVEPSRLRDLYDAIEPELYRYPAIDPSAFRPQARRCGQPGIIRLSDQRHRCAVLRGRLGRAGRKVGGSGCGG